MFIAGAGPAGAATAISLKAVAPKLRICLADPGRASSFRVGESVPPLAKRFIDHLGLSAAFAEGGHCPSFRTASAWGSQELIHNEFFLDVHNTGWRLDRNRFDRMMAIEAQKKGALPLNAQVHSLKFENEAWWIDCGEAGIHSARCIVDATGRTATLSRLAGLKHRNYDRLVAGAVFFTDAANTRQPGADAAVVESFQQGWWYTAAIPKGRRVIALMTDSDIARNLHLSKAQAWMEQLASTRHIAPLLSGLALTTPRLWPAHSRSCESPLNQPIPPGKGLIAVGDAFSCFDPLSSQGIIKALRSSIFASYAIADWLLKDDETGFARYQDLMKREFASYGKTLKNYYSEEKRWPDSPFWQRRHAGIGF